MFMTIGDHEVLLTFRSDEENTSSPCSSYLTLTTLALTVCLFPSVFPLEVREALCALKSSIYGVSSIAFGWRN